MNARPTITHGDAVERVTLAMLTTAASINRPAVLRALDAVAQYLRALDCDVCAADDEKDPDIAANAWRVLYTAACVPGGTSAADVAPLDDDALARAIAAMVLPMGPECGDVIAEMNEPGDLAADAERVDGWRAMFATVGGSA